MNDRSLPVLRQKTWKLLGRLVMVIATDVEIVVRPRQMEPICRAQVEPELFDSVGYGRFSRLWALCFRLKMEILIRSPRGVRVQLGSSIHVGG